jgi:hypothetical protein
MTETVPRDAIREPVVGHAAVEPQISVLPAYALHPGHVPILNASSYFRIMFLPSIRRDSYCVCAVRDPRLEPDECDLATSWKSNWVYPLKRHCLHGMSALAAAGAPRLTAHIAAATMAAINSPRAGFAGRMQLRANTRGSDFMPRIVPAACTSCAKTGDCR